MAEPMTNSDIDDVLSSIRRLVAQDLKPAERAKLAAVADATSKLVLAPELRVEDRGAFAAPRPEAPPEGAPKFVTVRRPSRRAAFPEIDKVLPGVDAAADGNGMAPAPEIAAQEIAAQEIAAPEIAAPEIEAPESFPESALESAPAFGAPPAFEGEAGAEDRAADESAAPEWALPQDEGQEPDASETDAPWEGFSPNPSDAQHYEDEGDAAPAAPLHGTIEPDPDWADAAEAQAIAELAGEAVHEAVMDSMAPPPRSAPSFTAKPQAEVLYDEDALREMVQRIFREEMAGPMGERITRNIRKLVRAEVGRLLAAQELE